MTHYIVISSNEIVKAEMERPERPHPAPPDWNIDTFIQARKKFQQHCLSLPRIPAPGHKWELWQEVVEGKDFKIEDQFWTGSAWWPTFHLVDGKVKPGTKTRTIAIPIQPTPEGEKVEEDKINIEAEHLQEDCHKMVELLMWKNRKITHQDATNVFIFRKLAELQLQINNLLTNPIREERQDDWSIDQKGW